MFVLCVTVAAVVCVSLLCLCDGFACELFLCVCCVCALGCVYLCVVLVGLNVSVFVVCCLLWFCLVCVVWCCCRCFAYVL